MGYRLTILLVLWAGAAQAAYIIPTPQPTATPANTPVPTATAVPVVPTATPQPTATLVPTATPIPTSTPIPTPTAYTAYDTIQEEGSGLTQRRTLNIIGAYSTCVDNSGATKTDCTWVTPTPLPTATPAPTSVPVNTPALTANTLSKGTYLQDSKLTDDGAGTLGFYPAAAVPTPVIQTFGSVVAGTTDTAGATTTINLSASTGTGVGGTLSIKNTNKAGTGSTVNTYGTVLSLSPPNTGTTAPVNYLDIKNAITGSGPTLSALGTDANINLDLVPKGTGGVRIPSTQKFIVGANANSYVYARSSGVLGFGVGATDQFELQNILIQLQSTMRLGWTSGTVTAAQDLILLRDGAAVLQMGVDSNTETDQTLKALDAVSGNNSGSDMNIQGGNKAGTGQDGVPVIGEAYTVATLPTGRPQGGRAWVTDQLTACAALGTAPTGGGAVVCPVFYNGSGWISG